MNLNKISVRYARALFETALEKDVIDSVYKDMKLVSRLCAMDDVKEVIDNPVLTEQKRKEIMLALTGDNIQKLTADFIDLVFRHGRGNYLEAAARNYIDITRRHKGIREVTLTTAIPLSDKTKNELASLIAGKEPGTIEFNENIDRSVIGGFVLRVDDEYIDASVRNKLNKFKKEFSLAGYDQE